MTDTTQLSASLEDYLEAIYNIIREKNAVRAKDIAKRLKVSNASVTGALRMLAKRKFLNYAPYDVITLTPEGERIAREIVRKHEVLRDFLVKVLSVDPGQADEAACRLEHGIPAEIVDRLVKFIEFLEICPLGGQKLVDGFRRHLQCGTSDDCDMCIKLAQELAAKESTGTGKIKKNTLADLALGEKAVIKKIKARGTLRKRLMDLGFLPGSVVEVERVAPAGDPIEVKVRGYHLSLRNDEAGKIEVDPR